MIIYHRDLASGQWAGLTFVEQMGNIGSEVSRALAWRESNARLFQGAVDRALELIDLTMRDLRWRNRLGELTRAREVLCDAVSGGKEYQSSLGEIDHYFFSFAVAARKKK